MQYHGFLLYSYYNINSKIIYIKCKNRRVFRLFSTFKMNYEFTGLTTIVLTVLFFG